MIKIDIGEYSKCTLCMYGLIENICDNCPYYSKENEQNDKN